MSQKSQKSKEAKSKPADELVKKAAGIELTEPQLEKVSGGACATGKHIPKLSG